MKRILIAGVGSLFLGDDGFGVEVAQQLSRRSLTATTQVIAFGIRADDLPHALANGYDATILIHATCQGDPPGTLHLIEPDLNYLEQFHPDPDSVSLLHMMAPLVDRTGRLFLLGCEPNSTDKLVQFGLSDAVSSAVPRALEMVELIIYNLLKESREIECIAA